MLSNRASSPPLLSPRQSPPPEKVFYDNRIKRKNVLALNEKVAAIREYEKMPVYKRVGRMFHCSPDQIKRIVQQKDSILKAWEQRTRRCQDAKTLEMKVVRVSMLGKAVYDWIRRMMYYMDFKITDGLIQKMALQFKSAMGLQNFFPHQDWCDKFRQTYNIHEIDSKQLKIGYAQGYSVQIKDVMKDVLSECTPDAARKASGDPTHIPDSDDDFKPPHPDPESGSENKRADPHLSSTHGEATVPGMAGGTVTKAELKLKAMPASIVPPSSNTATTTSTSTSSGSGKGTSSIPKLQPIRQLVALPLQGGAAGLPQKVLVATPITSVGSLTMNNLAPPMTMTIIPLATIAQTKSGSGAVGSNAQSTTDVAGAADKQPTVPPPMVEIKREIKQEPPDADDTEQQARGPLQVTQEPLLHVKQECMSDEEQDETENDNDDDDDDVVAMDSEPEPLPVSVSDSDSEREPEPEPEPEPESHLHQRVTEAVASKRSRRSLHSTEEMDTDTDNLALSSLRMLIKGKGRVAVGARAGAVAGVGALPARHDLPRLAPSPRERVHSARLHDRIQPTPLPSVLPLSLPLSLPLPPPPLIKAPTVAGSAMSPPSPAQAPAISNAAASASAYRRANRRSPHLTLPQLPPIKSCSEARQYLKMLEEFALCKENFRLIGLITRADEVLRELDGDDDIDVD